MQRRFARIKRPFATLRWLVRDTRGATAIEYGLIVAVVVIVTIVTIQAVADVTINMWDDVSSKSAEAHQTNR